MDFYEFDRQTSLIAFRWICFVEGWNDKVGIFLVCMY